MIWVAWWFWMAGALALAVLEVMVSGWIFLGFAIGVYLQHGFGAHALHCGCGFRRGLAGGRGLRGC